MEIIILKNKINFKRIGKWLIFLAWLIFIYFFSAQQGKESLALSNKVAHWFQAFFSSSSNLSFLVRKGAHFTVYFVLGILAFMIVKEYHVTWKQCFVLAFFLCMTYACMDELHQLYVDGRDGRIFDVLIDSCGSMMSILLLGYFYYFRKRKISN